MNDTSTAVAPSSVCLRCSRERGLSVWHMCTTCSSMYQDKKYVKQGMALTVDEFISKYPWKGINSTGNKTSRDTIPPTTTLSTDVLAQPGELIPGFMIHGKGMRHVADLIQKAAKTEVSVLIHGETGVGKELVAQAIHRLSNRSNHRLVVVDCTTLDDSIAGSELSGHVVGAYTGASSERKGLFGEAHAGTMFLDEVSSLSTTVQAKLLRFLELGEYRQVGGTKYHNADVRSVAATNQPLEGLMRGGAFRRDLFHRLNVFKINIPPLRDRVEELPLLIRFFLEKMGKSDVSIADDAMLILEAYDWPGNVRELMNVLRSATIMNEDINQPITKDDLPEELFS